MLNEKNERELCYITRIDNITPIEGYDRVELAHVLGWTVVVGKGDFKVGELALYFEIDSKLPEVSPFIEMEFLRAKHFKIKTQKMCKSISQGLLLPAKAFGGTADDETFIINDKEYKYGDFLTADLGVTYAVQEDNRRKAKSVDKYQKMAQRMGKKFSKQPYKWLMKRTWGKKLLFAIYGNRSDKTKWPAWVTKTDEERVQNMPWVLDDKSKWFATEKIDGTSTTFTRKGNGRKAKMYVCSRNVPFIKGKKEECYYDTNVYLEMAEKYQAEAALMLLRVLGEEKYSKTVDFVTLQGETYGEGIQKRDYGLKEHKFMAFNLIFGFTDGTVIRLNPKEMAEMCAIVNIPCVPIVSASFVLPDTVDELLEIATDKSMIDGGMREGLVFRDAKGERSFKAVSNAFLLKYHN